MEQKSISITLKVRSTTAAEAKEEARRAIAHARKNTKSFMFKRRNQRSRSRNIEVKVYWDVLVRY